MASTTTDPLLGRLVDGRYEIAARVARGGMATVYRAHDRRLGREVALKVMHPHLADGVDGASFVSRFRREARASARLSHPGVVAVFDQGLDGDTSYLTMEYVEGGNLRAALLEGPLPVGRALDVTTRVLDALAAAHRVGLVHRDVKPENVLLGHDGSVKVADFGLARAVTEVTSTASGTILGTVAYLAPEVIASRGAGPATDVFAVGVLLSEMLTGTVPYPGEPAIGVAYHHVHDDLPAPSERVPWLPPELDRLVASFTERDPQQRPVDAAAASAAVAAARAALDDEMLTRRAEPPVLPVPADDEHDATGPDGEPRASALPSDAVDAIPAALFTQDAGPGHRTEHLVVAPTHTMTAPVRTGPSTGPTGGGRTDRRGAVLRTVLLVLLLLGSLGAGAWWWFAAGPGAWTTVPAGLTGVTVEDARTELSSRGLEATVQERHHDEVPAGDVVSTDPAAGDRVRQDGAVTLVVSLGVRMLTVPENLVGADRQDARSALEGTGFTTEVEGAYDDSAPKGRVLAVSVPEGSEQRHDTVVTLTVSDGPAPVTVPQVVGRTGAEAEEALAGFGLRTAYADPEPSAEVAEGTVLRQDPEQGETASRTDTVTLTLSSGPPQVAVPDVIGMTTGEATTALEEAGFEVEVDGLLGGWLPAFSDEVRDQDPTGDAPAGSTVTITVW
ncbi:Stk1 family PASTA domain-containing Ser/Thr kinase [Isoptericola sp. b408]|uniref:Stk1 family PASTA domain-containing Ser/Thr kinase n=1 Tax=Isoptericola sp. b408 TaxID=3064653 RepID=UPI0027122D6D|nr:Stk1 family PASTA domain-containing Ser/Thr kinase [Isoptericola sp. b408]MDO8151221.1 Stk1 family PASTA domain-containing Ser/Thr kinase [Isoptericola sp. b408]